MLFLLWLACTGTDQDTAEEVCEEVPEGDVVLPLDEAPHGSDVEWWYWTGHLQDDQDRWYGFEEVFFLVDYAGYEMMMGHHAITNVDAQDFVYDVQYGSGEVESVDGGYGFEMGALTARGADGQDVLHGEAGGYVLDLELDSLKSPVLQHGTGYTEYEFGGNTYYYSRERLAAQGTLQVDGETLAVTGTGWFDHQWGELTNAIDQGWDWFALQLDDEREIMIFEIRVDGSSIMVGGSLSSADCETTELDPEQVVVTSMGEWTSEVSGCTYPLGWEMEVDGMSLTVTPVMEDQELYSSYQTYWEGAATVSGDATGRAYIELTGYCE
ncbi:MAG: lipocalin family protein [Myxococcota bacterium]|nr:lipocalin family protein [Myxococcota bacterium]